MHINYKSTDKQLKKPQTYKLKPKKFEKQAKFLTKLQKLVFFFTWKERIHKNSNNHLFTRLQIWFLEQIFCF